MYRIYELLNNFVINMLVVNDYKIVPFEEEPSVHFRPGECEGECEGVLKIKMYRNSRFRHELYLFANNSYAWSVIIVDDKTNEVVYNSRKDGYIPPAILCEDSRVAGLLMYDEFGNQIDAI